MDLISLIQNSSVSEMSDENCRKLLRLILHRHRGNLVKLEAQLQMEESHWLPIEIVNDGNIQSDLLPEQPGE
jgi:acetolactate synthase regulatory subunit